jgi:hypothetical protein
MRSQAKFTLRAIAAFVLLAAGFVWLGHAERSLWAHAPENALDRYALDRLLPELPARVAEDSLRRLCGSRPFWSRAWRSRDALAACLDRSTTSQSADHLETLSAEWIAAVERQIAFARSVETLKSADVLPVYQSLRELHRRLQQNSGGPILRYAERIGLDTRHSAAQPSIPDASERETSSVTAAFRAQRVYTEARLAVLRDAKPANLDQAWLRARDLGLLAAGKKLEHDNARIEPKPYLIDDRLSLGSRLEWARRAQPRAGVVLERLLASYLKMMAVSATFAVAMAAILRTSPLLVAALMLIATVGGLHLIDLAVTGPVALRALPVRDFGESPYILGGMLWTPAVLFAVVLIVAASAARAAWVIRVCERVLRWPLGVWGIALLAAFLGAMVSGIGSAARTEIFVFLAAVASALLISRYAPLLSYGASSGSIALYAAPIIGAGMCAGLVGNLAYSDLGALGVSVFAGLIAVAILARHWGLRFFLAGACAAGVSVYASFIQTGVDPTGLIQELPAHVVPRILVAHDARNHGQPDVQQVGWLIQGAERPGEQGAGWGWGNVPWTGLPGGRPYGLPLSAASDLAIVMPAGVGGALYAFASLGFLAAILIALVHRGLSKAFAAEARVGERFGAALGAFGLLTTLLRLIANVGGSLGAIPLTGVPIAFFAHAPAASLFTLFYAGMVLGASSGGRSK